MATDKEMIQAVKTIKEGCRERNCMDTGCPLAYICDGCFGDDNVPVDWNLDDLEDDEE